MKRTRLILGLLVILTSVSSRAIADSPPEAAAAFSAYAYSVEQRLSQQHGSGSGFIAATAPGSAQEAQVRAGLRLIEEVHPRQGNDLPEALLHHWRGTAFVPGATAADFERLLQNYSDYPRIYAPQVLRAAATPLPGGHNRVTMRVSQKHIITVVMDTTYDVALHHLDASRGYTISHSINISEIDAPGTRSEHALAPQDEHGFLWRQNTYWSYEERSGGLVIQVESISLSRAIPSGLGWIVKPFVQSVPRESLEFTLRATAAALRK